MFREFAKRAFVALTLSFLEANAVLAQTPVGARPIERSGADLVYLATESMRAVAPRSESAMCDAPTNLLPPAFDASDVLPGTEKVMVCLYLDQYAASKKALTFYRDDLPNVCSVKWTNGVAPWADPAQRKEMAAHGTKKKVLLSRAQMLSQGHSVRTIEQRKAYLASIGQIRDEMAPTCCGSDQSCLKAIKQLRIAQCSAEGDVDPNKPDSCTYANGYFDLSKAEKERFKEILDGKPLTQILPGEIVLSPYLRKDGTAVAPEATIRHELGHACSSIRRQSAMLKGGLKGFRSSESLDAQLNNACDVGDVNKVAYAELLNASNGASAAQVFDCVYGLSEKTFDRNSNAYFEESCGASKLEEGMAEAIALSVMNPLVPNGFPNRICYARPSTRHLASSDIFACLIKNNPKIRSRLSMELACDRGGQ